MTIDPRVTESFNAARADLAAADRVLMPLWRDPDCDFCGDIFRDADLAYTEAYHYWYGMRSALELLAPESARMITDAAHAAVMTEGERT